MPKLGDIVRVRMAHVMSDWSVNNEDRLAVVDVHYCKGCICDPRGFNKVEQYKIDGEYSIKLVDAHDSYEVLDKTYENYLLLPTEARRVFRYVHGIKPGSTRAVRLWFAEQAELQAQIHTLQQRGEPKRRNKAH